MRKTVFVVLMAAVLVLAFATTAMAATGVPNRSSAYLPTIVSPTSTGAAEAEVAGGGTKAAYVTWTKAVTDMTNAGEPLRSTPHADYATTTIKCQVCHSVHKAAVGGTNLLMNSGGGCVVCHGATSTVGSTKKVSADGAAAVQGGYSNEDQRHGKVDSCASYECHATSPHGVGVSTYAVAKSAMLSNAVDPLIQAAIASGVSNAPVTAVLTDDWVTDPLGMNFDKVEIDVFQPALDGAEVTAITAPVTVEDVARGRAIVTGYTCANNGCHINGSFNGLSADAYFGAYRTFQGGVEIANGFPTDPNAHAGQENLRTQPIKGHSLFSTALGNQTVGDETAYAASGACKSCHDATDVRLGVDVKMFPHSNAVWAVADAAGTGNNVSGAFTDYGYVRLYSDAAWFNLADSTTDATPVRTNTRNISATAPTYDGGAQYTVGMDGACLKCHRDGTVGVGITY